MIQSNLYTVLVVLSCYLLAACQEIRSTKNDSIGSNSLKQDLRQELRDSWLKKIKDLPPPEQIDAFGLYYNFNAYRSMMDMPPASEIDDEFTIIACKRKSDGASAFYIALDKEKTILRHLMLPQLKYIQLDTVLLEETNQFNTNDPKKEGYVPYLSSKGKWVNNQWQIKTDYFKASPPPELMNLPLAKPYANALEGNLLTP